MKEIISNIYSKYGLGAVIGMLLAVIVIWAVAHNMSAPGGKVSVIWGLVEYTKPLIKKGSTTAISMPKKTKVINVETLSASESKNTISIFFRNLTNNDFKRELQRLRNSNSLRPLSTLESGKIIGKTPRGTYFFTFYAFLSIDSGVFEDEIQRYRTRSTPNRYVVEIHHSTEGKFYLVGFVSKTHAVEISQLSGLNKKKVTFSPIWHPEFSSLVRIPASRILASSDRELDMPEGKLLGVLDIELQ